MKALATSTHIISIDRRTMVKGVSKGGRAGQYRCSTELAKSVDRKGWEKLTKR